MATTYIPTKRCPDCGFRIRGENHATGIHHKTMVRTIRGPVGTSTHKRRIAYAKFYRKVLQRTSESKQAKE